MNQIKSFDRTTVRNLRTQLEWVLNELEGKCGVKFTLGTIRFSESEFRCRMTASVPELKAKQRNPNNIKPQPGVSFKVRRTWYTIQEVLDPSLKYCLSVKTQRGKRWKVPMSMFENAERITTPAWHS